MATKKQVADILGILATTSIIAAGFIIGGTLAPAIIGGIGINLASTLVQNGGAALRKRWLSSNEGILNQDLQQALVRAFLKALKLLETEYFKQGQANALPQNEKASIKAFFKELGEQTQEVFKKTLEEIEQEQKAHEQKMQAYFRGGSVQVQDTSLMPSNTITKEQELKNYLYGTQEQDADLLWHRINGAGLLSTYGEHFRDFFRKHLFGTVQLCFTEELQIDSKESNRAWRAFQRLMLEGIQAELLTLNADHKVVKEDLKKLDDVRSRLDQLRNVIEHRQHDEPFHQALEQAIHDMQSKLQLIVKSTQRTEDLVSWLVATKTKRNYGLPVADHVEELLGVYTKLFVGREDTLMELDEFVTQEPKGFRILTARAGFGKTALLANWVVSLLKGRPSAVKNNTPVFVAYHFFNSSFSDTCSPTKASRHLIRQFFKHYKPDNKLPSNVDDIEDELYGIVRDHAMRKGEVLIIVLDGLDEIVPDRRDETDEPFFTHLFPTTLPENVFVIASARADEGEAERPYLRAWTDKATEPPLKLERLSQTTIAEWLQQVADGTLSALATDTDFIARLDEVTQGFPLYLRHLIDGLQESVKQGKDARAVLAETPQGFEKYVHQQFVRLDALKLPQKIWMSFALLTVAKGPLHRDDLKAKALTGMDDRALRMLRKEWQLSRWLRITPDKKPILYTFAHPLLAKMFAEELGDEATKALKRLLAYCERWSQHKSLYALQHYAEHLQENKQIETLFRLVRDGAFLRAQVEILPDDLDLPLRTVQIALRCAAEKDDAGAMAEFLPTHARQLLKVTQISPLELTRGGNPSRSVQVASKMEHHVLWYLLLAWEFKEKRDGENALEALKSLRQLDVRLPLDWQSAYAAYLLSHLFEVDEDICILLSRQFLDEDSLSLLCRYLVARRRFSFARKVALGIQDEVKQAKALLALAEAQVETGALDDAREAMEQVGWSFEYNRDEPWSKIAHAYAVVGTEQAQEKKLQEAEQTFKIALQAANHVSKKQSKAKVLLAIAKAQAQIDQIDDARVTFATARMVIEQMEILPEEESLRTIAFGRGIPKEDWVKALMEIALAQVEVGEIEEARETALKMDDVKGLSRVLREIVAMHAQARAFDDALTVLEQIEDTEERILARVAIAMALISTRNEEAKKLITEALQAAGEMQPGEEQVRVIRKLAVAQAQMGDKQEAHNTLVAAHEVVQKIADRSQRVKLLSKIAKTQFQLGEEEEAQITFSTTLKALQDERTGFWRDKELEDLIIAQAQVGFAAGALEAVGQIKAHYKRIEMLKEVALVQAQLGKKVECQGILALACETVQKIRWSAGIDGEREMKNLAIAQAQQEFFSDAFGTRDKIKDKLELAETWLAIARILMDKKEQDQGSAACIEAGKIAQAFQPPPVIFDIDLRLDRLALLLRIAEAQAQAGEGEEARATIALTLIGEERSDEESLLKVTLANIDVATASAQRQKGETVSAQRILVAASQAALKIGGDKQEKVLRMITLEQVKMKDWEGALRTAELPEAKLSESERAGMAEIIIRDMAETAVAQSQEGKDEAAQETLVIAQDVMRKNTDRWEPERVRALVSIAKAQAKIGKKVEAEASFATARESAQAVGEEHAEEAYARSLVAIATGQAEVGAFEDAYSTAQMIRYSQGRGEALKAIAVKRMAVAISQFTDANQEQAQKAYDAALQLLEEIPDNEERVAALGEIGIALAQADRKSEARKTFDRAFEIAKRMRRYLESKWVMMDVAVAQARAQEFKKATETIQEIKEFEDRQQELPPKVRGLSAIAREQARAMMRNDALNTFTDALQMAQEIENTPYRMWELGLIAQRQAQVGFGMQALQTAELILTDRNVYLPMIAEALVNAGDVDHVKRLLIPCAYYLNTAYEMCGLLAWAYPEQAEAVAKAVRVPS